MREPRWDASVILGVAQVLGDTEHGMTGSQIETLLASLKMPDPGAITKWRRLDTAFTTRQHQDSSPTRLITFITHAMSPALYLRNPEEFSRRQDGLNEVLNFGGIRITDKGQVAHGSIATTLDEAAQHAATMRSELRRRSTHPDALAYCTVELLKKSYFHASLEAVKGVFERLRTLSGHTGDGAKLIDTVLAPGSSGSPVLAINSGNSTTERDEQSGFANLIKGLNSMYRNPTAHDPRLRRTVTDDELLELLTTLSMIHRRLDTVTVRP